MTQQKTLLGPDIRRQIELELGAPVSESIWGYLVDIGKIGAVEQGTQDIHWLAEELRKAQKAFGVPVQGEQAPHVEPEPAPWRESQRRLPTIILGPASNEAESRGDSPLRRDAISVLLASEAEKDPGVIAFRNKFLNGGTLRLAEVERWLKEQAQRDEGPRDWLAVPVVPDPQGTITTKVPERDAENYGSHIRWRVAYEGEVSSCVESRYIAYGVPGDRWQRIQLIAPGGVLEKLWKLVKDLTSHYRPWTAGQAAMFVLTGLPPQVQVIEGRVEATPPLHAATRLVLTVDPAVTPQELAEAYSRMRAKVTPTRPRSLSIKHIRLALFSTEASDKDSWERKMQYWNDMYPEAQYPGYTYNDRRLFRRDVLQARDRLLHPPYQT
jgi:hypothetical protein